MAVTTCLDTFMDSSDILRSLTVNREMEIQNDS